MRRHPVVSSADGVYRVCRRCGTDTDVPGVSVGQVRSCALVRDDWLCKLCWIAHWTACDICLAQRKAA